MFRKVFILVMLAFISVILFSGTIYAEPNLAELNKNCVAIGVMMPNGMAVGSGFIFRDASGQRYVMTNFHVVRDDRSEATAIQVIFHNRVTSVATIWRIDPLYDLAILRVNYIPADLAGINLVDGISDTDRFIFGDKLYKIGTPLGFFDIPGNGRFLYIVRIDELDIPCVNCLLAKIDCDLGDSGCAVFDDNGKLAGICFLGYFSTQPHLPQNIMGVLPARIVRDRVAWMLGKSQNGSINIGAIRFEAQAIGANMLEGGLVVVQSGEAMLLPGDIILRVEREKIGSVELFRHIARSFNAGDTLKLRIVRSGVEQDIVLILR